MCGFTGIVSQETISQFLKNRIIKSQEIARYRGPDENLCAGLNNIFLSFNRLSINHLENGHQPLIFNEGVGSDDSIICFNGEIFNHKELEQSYLSKPFDRDEIGVLADLYKKIGDNMFKLLNGQFSVAIYSSKNRELTLARDPFGIRPLFYTFIDKNKILFGSDLKTFWEFGLSKKASISQLARIHLTWATSSDQTVWENINQIRPGHYYKFDLDSNIINNAKKCCYWDWSVFIHSRNKSSQKLKTDDVEKFRHEYQKSVKRQSMSDVSVGCYLSGGIDSSVTAFELTQIQKDLKTYSVVFEDKQYDESQHQ